ncbi:MAG: hypothetical protein ACK4M3_03805 [Pyrobaculum sp.]
MLSLYGVVVTLMGIVGNEAELTVVGLVMLFIGNLHILGKILLYIQRGDKCEELRVSRGVKKRPC